MDLFKAASDFWPHLTTLHLCLRLFPMAARLSKGAQSSEGFLGLLDGGLFLNVPFFLVRIEMDLLR